MAITVKEAVIVAIIVESILYGKPFRGDSRVERYNDACSIRTVGVLVWGYSMGIDISAHICEIPRLMLCGACLLFILGTMHIVVDASHFWHGFITSGDPDAFFQDVTKNTFKNALYLIETVVSDAIIIYRSHLMWRRIEVIIIPIIGWIAVVVTGTYTVWAISQLSATNPNIIFLRQTAQWVISFCSTALATNLIATGLLTVKLWVAHRNEAEFHCTNEYVFHPILVIIMECGAVYSLSMTTMLVVYLSGSNSMYILIDMIGQIIPITFCVIIVRGAMLRFERDRVELSRRGDL
ncbi:hypothetical protein PAXINDRAFT_17342 [Paxillus involutus ATCC 200175]|uniref:Uncharacterized protein n=1 Tax=Paxillus involutus ATCC 200175 TaxID=664439 RepID=A0A0C9T1H3_PAXIN|nr:hypothetical protein PAXINDRAFT_17342 [Paxillus involutus ATCC 200175]